MLGRKPSIRLRPVRDPCLYGDGKPTTTQPLSWDTPRSADTQSSEEPIGLGVVNRTGHDVCRKEDRGDEAIMGLLDRPRQGEGEGDPLARIEV